MSSLPYVTLQCTYPSVFEDVSSGSIAYDKAWLSAYQATAPRASLHAHLDLEPCKEIPGDKETQSGVKVTDVRKANGTAAEIAATGLRVERIMGDPLDLLVSAIPPNARPESSTTQANRVRSSIVIQPTLIRLPRRNLGPILTGRNAGVLAFDVSRGGTEERFVAGGADGELVVGHIGSHLMAEAEEGENVDDAATLSPEERIEKLAQRRMKEALARKRADERVQLKGHVGDVRSARFFPSGEVVLSTSSDLSVRIFSAVDGSNPRTLTGHKRAVLCSALIGVGREVLTGSADGTVRLWDVSSGAQTRMLGVNRYSGVSGMSLLDEGGQKIVVGLSSGAVELHDTRIKTSSAGLFQPFSFPPGHPPGATDSWTQTISGGITALDAHTDGRHVAVGTSKGVAAVWDLNAAQGGGGGSESAMQVDEAEGDQDEGMLVGRGCVAAWSRNGAEINDVRWNPDAASDAGGTPLVVACADGLAYAVEGKSILSSAGEAKAELREPRVNVEYAGWDAGEPIESIALDRQGRVWLAGDRGFARRY